MSISMIILTIILFFVIRFVFKFIVPVLHITKVTSERMRQMQQQMEDMSRRADIQKSSTSRPNPSDYIEFEEVK